MKNKEKKFSPDNLLEPIKYPERKLGEIFTYTQVDKKGNEKKFKVKCVQGDCDQCVFHGKKTWSCEGKLAQIGHCSSFYRSDKNTVMFILNE